MTHGRAAGVGPRTVLMVHPSAELYGSDRVMLSTAVALRDAGRTVVVAVPADGPLVEALRSYDVETVVCPSPVLRKSLLSPAGLLRLVAESARGAYAGWRLLRRTRADVLYVSTVTMPLWPVLGRLTGRQVVTHVHEAEASASGPVRRVLALPAVLAHRALVNSRFSLDVLVGVAPRLRHRSTVVPNAVPGPADPPPPRERLDGPVRLVYVGRLSERKGVDVAVAALAEVRRRGIDAELDLVGAVYPGYEWFEQGLRDRAAVDGTAAAVRFRGFHPDVWTLLAEADIVLVPSVVDEPFGNTAVEAVLAARPAVVSRTSGLREAAAGYASVAWADPGDVTSLADAIATQVAEWPQRSHAAVLDSAIARERHGEAAYAATVVPLVDPDGAASEVAR